MNRWWIEQRKRLWWKEFQEIWPYLGLAWLVIHIFMLLSPITRGYIWGYSFHLQAATILIFISVVLGVTAYAVESEHETLQPLLARPISENDILATKLGVRLGLLFLSMLYLGMIELATGAWPIEFRIPSPVFFERWVGTLMQCGLAIGLGLYFGKTLGRQTQALMASVLVFLGGWILLGASPLAWAFEGTEERSYTWIRDILIPGLAAAAVILLTIPARIGEGGFFARRRSLVAGGALFLYAFLLWLFLIVPPGDEWLDPVYFKERLTIQYAGPKAGLDVLSRDLAGQRQIPHQPEETIQRIINNTYVWSGYVWSGRWVADATRSFINWDALGRPQQVARSVQGKPRLGNTAEYIEVAAEKRSPDWIASCLELARDPSRDDIDRITALILAGVAGYPEQTSLIAAYLGDPSPDVVLFAAMMLTFREDPTGTAWLRRWVLDPENDDRIAHFVTPGWGWWLYIEPGPEAHDVMREWALMENASSRNRAARDWFRRYGTLADLPIILRSIAIEQYPDDDILTFLKAWDSPEYVPVLLDSTLSELAALDRLKPSIDDIPLADRRRGVRLRGVEGIRMRLYARTRSSLGDHLSALLQEGVGDALEFWARARPHFQEYLGRFSEGYLSYERFIRYCPQLGGPGIETLKALATSRSERPPIRFQACLVLAAHGQEEYHEQALTIYDTYKDGDSWFRGPYPLEAFRILLSEDHLAYAGPLIENLWHLFREKRSFYGPQMITRYRELEESTGRSFGWNIKAWKRWWEREGRQQAEAQLAGYGSPQSTGAGAAGSAHTGGNAGTAGSD